MPTSVSKHLKFLVQEIGARPIGSAANHKAATYIRKVFEESGFCVNEQQVDCPSWHLESAFIEFDQNRVEVIGNTFTPACDVSSTVVAISTLAELEAAHLEGKIALLYGEIIRIGFIAKSFKLYNPEINQRLIAMLEEKHPAAIITVATTTENVLPLINDWDFSIPSITVPPELGLQLMDHNGSLRVTIRSTMDRDYTLNVFGTRKSHKHEKLILCAHYDTAFNCPGAVDNSAGLACLLSLAEILGQLEFSCGIELITFSGEEFAAIGDQAYLKDEPDFENMLAVINMDGVGQKLGNNTLTAIGTSKALEAEVKKIKSDYPMMVWAEPWYESDHTLFLMNGVPCLPLNSLGINDIYHQPKDQLKWVSTSKLEEVINVVL